MCALSENLTNLARNPILERNMKSKVLGHSLVENVIIDNQLN